MPTPSLVSTSRRSACSTRPSMMCELATPFLTASSAEPIFGSMPPWIVPSAKSASIRLADRPGEQRAVLVEHADGVRHQHELFRLQRLRELAGDEVRVDVVGDAVGADADGRDHRDEIARVEELDELGVDALDLADESDVDHLAVARVALQQHLPRMDERAVLSGEPDRLAAVLVDEADDLLIELAQHHLDDVHHALVGDAHALAKLALRCPSSAAGRRSAGRRRGR